MVGIGTNVFVLVGTSGVALGGNGVLVGLEVKVADGTLVAVGVHVLVAGREAV